MRSCIYSEISENIFKKMYKNLSFKNIYVPQSRKQSGYKRHNFLLNLFLWSNYVF